MTAVPAAEDPRSLGLVWWGCLVVALGAIALTAHGLFDVAAHSGVWVWLAWIYPVITDGLALVAYLAAARLRYTRACVYAWTVVLLAAGLSGIAQAVHLAGGVGQVPVALRAVIGGWPAVAFAMSFHLLFLIHRATYGNPTPPKPSEPFLEVPERVTPDPSPVAERPRPAAKRAAKRAAPAREWTAADVLNADAAAGTQLGFRRIAEQFQVGPRHAQRLRAEANETRALFQTDAPTIDRANGSP